MKKKSIVIWKKGYSNKRTFAGLKVNEAATLNHLVEAASLSEPIATDLSNLTTAKEMTEALAGAEQTEASQKLASLP